MESRLANGLKLLYLPKKTKINSGLGDKLPEAYKKFYLEWRHRTPEPVYFQPKTGKWMKDSKSGQVVPVQNIPIPLKYPKTMHTGIWGGEAIVQGFKQKGKYKSRVPYFWVPTLKNTVVYSEVLNKYMSTIVTERAIELINKNYGLDHYLLKTPACDLKTTLSLKIKRNILMALRDKTLYPDNIVKQQAIYDKYKHYLNDYSHEDIEWYGLTFDQALLKFQEKEEIANLKREPLKAKFRTELIKELKTNKDNLVDENKSWLNKINPFK
ncbi:39S ribosomal protein L28, mitochondrial [Daktulosphaira vitifoliae]|uniref:39S ribosomal protein L28, mitochondrial n=1 Tax=Daktulosphaira vitifoliae TaxID=58002 RepID=UPI0021AAF98F|nr:39S ribosomal protein L28, mitochondrial [Daktulosphaira vitifoliae]XP_050543623.1 39S ribosomal protein L28, mitochondrial [Daktulosphaira vitifoliae]XP_050543624.1 39S ribosomal protein L28, mitochondrial [Daktulosphaira vitifoliae]XP_050543625.1 39S ribosomal protein L28, mitochondrial [Daktulosphaira vitifoliae]XP_050543626.1 39S ribosomal protein L28, mitochondrial [Daktulosphaira vitifoliae]XP_050543627.1 39S ribosomal protein L28, mitochondrial [Daktulosphaira vitifoliae]